MAYEVFQEMIIDDSQDWQKLEMERLQDYWVKQIIFVKCNLEK